jgi:hypothetical protein
MPKNAQPIVAPDAENPGAGELLVMSKEKKVTYGQLVAIR